MKLLAQAASISDRESLDRVWRSLASALELDQVPADFDDAEYASLVAAVAAL